MLQATPKVCSGNSSDLQSSSVLFFPLNSHACSRFCQKRLWRCASPLTTCDVLSDTAQRLRSLAVLCSSQTWTLAAGRHKKRPLRAYAPLPSKLMEGIKCSLSKSSRRDLCFYSLYRFSLDWPLRSKKKKKKPNSFPSLACLLVVALSKQDGAFTRGSLFVSFTPQMLLEASHLPTSQRRPSHSGGS